MEKIDYKKLENAIAYGLAKGFFFIIMVYLLIVLLVFIPINFIKSDDTCLKVGNMIDCPKGPDSKNEINIL